MQQRLAVKITGFNNRLAEIVENYELHHYFHQESEGKIRQRRYQREVHCSVCGPAEKY